MQSKLSASRRCTGHRDLPVPVIRHAYCNIWAHQWYSRGRNAPRRGGARPGRGGGPDEQRSKRPRQLISATPNILLAEDELEFHFILASGPGGQKVNKVATAVQLRFDVRRSPSLPPDVRERLATLAHRRLTRDGVLVITARRYRTQPRNRQDAVDRLIALIRQAAERPKPRRQTAPSRAARERRLQDKLRRADRKRQRRSIVSD